MFNCFSPKTSISATGNLQTDDPNMNRNTNTPSSDETQAGSSSPAEEDEDETGTGEETEGSQEESPSEKTGSAASYQNENTETGLNYELLTGVLDQLTSESDETPTRRNMKRPAIMKDYGLDLASELQTKLDQLRVDYEVLDYKLNKSKSKSGDLERENTRLRRELEQHNQYQIKTHKALATHSSDLMTLRSKYLDVQTELERVKFELNGLKNDHKVVQKKLFTQTTQEKELQRSMDTLIDAARRYSNDEIDYDEYADTVVQVNNNRKSSVMLARRGQSEDVLEARQSRSEIGRASSNPAVGDKFKPYYDQIYSPRGARSPSYNMSKSRMPEKSQSHQLPQRSMELRSVPNLSPRTRRSSPVFRSPSPSAILMPRQLPTKSPSRRASNNKTVVLTNVSPPMHARSRLQAGKTPSRRSQAFQPVKPNSRVRPSRMPQKTVQRSCRKVSGVRPRGRGRGVVINKLQHNTPHGSGTQTSTGNVTVQEASPKHDSRSAISMLNRLLRGVHFNSHNNLFYPGGLHDDDEISGKELPASLRQELSERLLSDILETTEQGAHVYEISQSAIKRPTKESTKHKKNQKEFAAKDICKKLSKDMVAAQVKTSKTKKKLSENEKFIRGQYQQFLEKTLAQNQHPLHTRLAGCKLLNKNNNANESQSGTTDIEGDDSDWLDITESETSDENITVESQSFTLGSSQVDSRAIEPTHTNIPLNSSRRTAENANNNAISANINSNINSSADPGYIHPEVTRLQHLLHQREIQQRDFMEAFTDALLAKEAALSLAQERLETISMLEIRIKQQREEYEAILDIKLNELRIKSEVIAGYKKERFSLARAFEKATKCMLAKLNAKNSVIRRMNLTHHDEISQLRLLVMQQETELNTTTDTLQRMKIFQEREIIIYNQKIKELHDLLKLKDAELNNYQQLSADVVHMAEKMNLDLHVKDDIIQQLRNDLSNFQVGVNEVEGDRVLVKQSSSDKRVTSLGFPRIVDGSVIIWYKSRTHGDNFLVMRIFGGKLFVVDKKDIIAELNRILPNLLNNPSLTHAALKLDKGTQAPQDQKLCNPPSAMQMQIHMVGNRAHLAMEGRHLCSQHPVQFIDDDEDIALNKEITPRPYETACSPIEKRILLTEVDRHKDFSDEDDDSLSVELPKKKRTSRPGSTSGSEASTASKRRSLLDRFKDLFRGNKTKSQTGYTPQGATPASTSQSASRSASYSQDPSGTSGKTTAGDNESEDSSSSDSDSDSSDSPQGNKTRNAKRNYSHNARVSEETDSEVWREEEIDLDKDTDKLLTDMREERERVSSESSEVTADGDSLKLDEFKPLYPRQPTLEYSMEWFSESESPKKTKSWCKSPMQRLKRLELDIDGLRRITSTKTRQKADKNEKQKSPQMSPIKDDFDWSLPDLDVPDEFYRSAAGKLNKRSDHDTRALEAAKCSINRDRKPNERTRFLQNEAELIGVRANSIGEDYKFTRLSNDTELERFVSENTVNTNKDKDPYKPFDSIRFDDETKQFELPDSSKRKSKSKSKR